MSDIAPLLKQMWCSTDAISAALNHAEALPSLQSTPLTCAQQGPVVNILVVNASMSQKARQILRQPCVLQPWIPHCQAFGDEAD